MTMLRVCDCCGEMKDIQTKQITEEKLLDDSLDLCRSCKRLLKEAIRERMDAIESGSLLTIK